MSTPDRHRAPIGLALAGGGPQGGIYEVGALRALDEAIEGLDLNDAAVYVGVSAGAFVAASLANNLTTAQLCRAVIKTDPHVHPFLPRMFLSPAVEEWAQRAVSIPGRLIDALTGYLRSSPDERQIATWLIEQFATLLPVGIFDNRPIRRYLEKVFSVTGRSDDFRTIRRPLYVVATDLESGESVRFGEPGFDHVPISLAVQASTALPGIYPPVQIDGRYYVDGVLQRTLHASVALDHGARLVFAINPIVPVDTNQAIRAGTMRHGELIERGLPTVLSQTLRTIVHSRLKVGIRCYEERFPGADVLLIEPLPDDYQMFAVNIFRFSARKAICEHAYLSTLRYLADQRSRLGPMLARHGLRLRNEVLDREHPSLWEGLGISRRPGHPTERLQRTLGELEALLERETNGQPNPHQRWTHSKAGGYS